MEEIIQIVSNVGFPIAMCFYLAFRFEKTIRDNTLMVQELKTEIHLLKKR